MYAMSHLPENPAACTANGSHTASDPPGPIEGAESAGGRPTAARVREVAEAIYVEVDRGMARQLGIDPDRDRRYGFDELTDGVKLVYRRAALKAIEAAERA
jgi:hypothetical protein